MIKLRYTISSGILNSKQRRFFEENGYLILENLIDKAILNECRKRFVDICQGKVKTNAMILQEVSLLKSGKYGENVINKIQDIYNDEVFMKFYKNENLLNAVSSITGPKIQLFLSMFINKPPKSMRHPAHQDGYYFPFDNKDRSVNVWTAIDEAKADNGCLFTYPGSHKQDKCFSHIMPKDKVNIGFTGIDEERFCSNYKNINLEIKAGDTILLHPHLIHGSRPNTSDRLRKAMTGFYKSTSCQFVEEEKDGYDDMVKLHNEENRKNGIAPISRKEYWQQKLITVRDGEN